MPIFYTRKGDDGRSRIGRKIVKKTCLEVEALGQLDELNSMIGMVKNLKKTRVWRMPLHQVQENLFIIQSHVANLMLGGDFKIPNFDDAKVKEAEKIIDGIEHRLPLLKKFVIPGANPTSAWLDFLRAKSRNVERAVLSVFETTGNISPDFASDKAGVTKSRILDLSSKHSGLGINRDNNSNISNIRSYLNRLSSLFFALARWEARGKKEQNPQYK